LMKKGFPTTEGLVTLYTEGITQKDYILAIAQSVNVCLTTAQKKYLTTPEAIEDTVITCDESVEAVKAKTMEVLNQLTEAHFQHCFEQWKSRMERCRDRQREYIEGEKVVIEQGKTCDIAYDVFDCVSEEIGKYCGQTP
ncbi:hypothetical protein NQ318_014277, partial [Aromia moschata]